MKILVYGINYSPELTGIGKYTGEMVEWMASQGHDVRVITAPPYYPEWKVGERYSGWRYRREEGAATVWRCPLYVPKQPSTLKRLLHLGSFALSSFFPLMAQRRWKPDRIIGVVPTLFCTPGMRLLGKLSGARTLLHIQDYEVDAMLGLGMAGKGKSGKVAKLASAFERSGLHNVDYVSTISRSMMNKAQEKGVPAEKVIFFPNWSEVARFRDVTDSDAQALRAQLGLPDDQKIILYSGNIGEKQGAGERHRRRTATEPSTLDVCHRRAGRRKSATGKNGQRARPDEREIFPASVLRGTACVAEDGRLPSGGTKARRGRRGAAVQADQHSGSGR